MTYTETTNVAYGPLPSETMEVLMPQSSTPTGAVIWIHGGGWVSGCATPNDAIPAAYARNGMAVFDINYTLFQNGVTTWSDVYGSVLAAVSFIKAHAADFNVDPNAIGAAGGSAGAQIASLLGVTGQVAFVVDNSGPEDLTNLIPRLQWTVDHMIGVDGLKGASPIDNISGATVPFFITQGLQDTTVDPSQSEVFYAALLANGTNATLLEYTGGHVFQNTDPTVKWDTIRAEVQWAKGQVTADLAQSMVQHMAAMGGGGGALTWNAPDVSARSLPMLAAHRF